MIVLLSILPEEWGGEYPRKGSNELNGAFFFFESLDLTSRVWGQKVGLAPPRDTGTYPWSAMLILQLLHEGIYLHLCGVVLAQKGFPFVS